MYPLLLQIGPIALYSYGFFTASGFLTATYYIVKVSNKAPSTPQNTKQLGNTRPTPPHTVLSEDAVYGLIFACIIGGVLGARLTYVLLNLGSFRDNILSVFKVWEGGLVFYGGFLTAFISSFIYAKRKKVSFMRITDVFAPAVLIGHFFGRIGCFMAGCCFGRVSTLPWAVKFTNAASLAPQGIHLHPVQLYEAFGNLILFFVLHRYNQKPHVAGTTFSLYLIFYPLMRFFIEFLRADDRGGNIFVFSPSQALSLIMFGAGLALFITLKRKAQIER